MGGTTSALQTVQAKVGEMRAAQTQLHDKPTRPANAAAELASIEIPTPPPTTTTTSSSITQPSSVQPGVPGAGTSADIELPQVPTQSSSTSGWSSLWSWIPGTGSGTSTGTGTGAGR